MIKKILWGLLAVIILYFAIGIGLMAAGVIHRLYFFPGYSIKKGSDRTFDKSGINVEGPIVVYGNSVLTTRSIVKTGDKFKIETDTISNRNAHCLTAFASDTNAQFSFSLKDSLKQEPAEYALPDKMLILSDIEGNFKGFTMILRGAGVIDTAFNWSFGNGHLVLNGDFFDRGLNVNQTLWLIYKLEQQAALAGGKVHFILGNHEIMNLTGKHKYVRNQYLKNADTLKFDYDEWYTPKTELGRWLRTKNVIEKIGNMLFTHGGISKDLAQLNTPIQQINSIAKNYIDKPKPDKNDKAAYLIAATPESPYWYRGMAEESMSKEEVATALKKYNVDKVIIAHTILGKIKYLYNKQVIAIDLPHQENSDKGFMNALWYQNGKFYIINHKGQKTILQ
jgi:hypothetical protein